MLVASVRQYTGTPTKYRAYVHDTETGRSIQACPHEHERKGALSGAVLAERCAQEMLGAILARDLPSPPHSVLLRDAIPKRRRQRAQEPLADLTADVERATREHYAGREHVRCFCGSIAFVAFHDRTTQTAGLQCLVCASIPPGTFRLMEG